MKPARGTAQSEKPIQVFVRVRPLNQLERNAKSFSVVSVNNEREISVKERPTEKVQRNFCFDKAFGPDSKQVDVYKKVVYPLIEEVLAGYNCTVFAYGQTGTGKTFTMEGGKSTNMNVSWEDDPLTGIIPRSLSHLFDELRISQLEHSVRVSFLELYNEELFDLLSPPDDANKLRLYEDSNKKGSVIIQNLEEVPVANKGQLYQVLEKGSQKRQTAATLMNAHSSRSHTIFSITVHIKETSDKGEELFKIGKLNLVDLAGSENIGRSGAVDKRAREAGNINQSLLTLGRVITSLVEKAPHIPYRESKLTRLLQDSLGGRTKTSIIATVSPALCNLEETISTLEYAARAKSITNRPEINQKLTKKAFLKEYEAEIDRLKRDLQASRDRNGVYVDSENYTKMTLQLDEQEREIGENLSLIKTLKGELEKREEIYAEINASLMSAKDEIEKRKEDCRKTRMVLKEVTVDRNVNKILKEKHMETESKLRKQAEQILSVADVATADIVKLHEKIERKGSVETNNVSACDQFCTSLRNFLVETELNHKNQKISEEEFFKILRNSMSNVSQTQSECLNDLKSQLQFICQILSEKLENFTTACQSSRNEKHKNLSENLNKLKSKLDSNNDVLDASILKGITPQLGDAFDHLNELDKVLIDLSRSGEEVKSDVSCLKREVNRLKIFTKERIERYVASILNIQTEVDEFDRLDAVVSDLMKTRAENCKKFTISLETAFKAFEDFKKSEDETNEQLNSATCSLRESIKITRASTEKLATSIKDDFRECEPIFTEVIGLLNTVDHSLDSQKDIFADKLESWKDAEKIRLEIVKVNVENLTSVSRESKKIFCDWSEDFSETLQKSDFKETQAEKEAQQALMDTISGHISESELAIDNCESSHETAVEEMENNVEDRLYNSRKCQEEIIKSLQSQHRLVDQFLQEDIKTDVPTGCTPQKRDFEYPHNLTATSPHAIILERYCDAINKQELSFNDSLNETAANIASEEIIKESSSCESISVSAASSMTSLDQKENDTEPIMPLFSKKLPQSTSKKRVLMETN